MGRELKEAVQESMIVSITALELQMCGLGGGNPPLHPGLGLTLFWCPKDWTPWEHPRPPGADMPVAGAGRWRWGQGRGGAEMPASQRFGPCVR